MLLEEAEARLLELLGLLLPAAEGGCSPVAVIRWSMLLGWLAVLFEPAELHLWMGIEVFVCPDPLLVSDRPV